MRWVDGTGAAAILFAVEDIGAAADMGAPPRVFGL